MCVRSVRGESSYNFKGEGGLENEGERVKGEKKGVSPPYLPLNRVI